MHDTNLLIPQSYIDVLMVSNSTQVTIYFVNKLDDQVLSMPDIRFSFSPKLNEIISLEKVERLIIDAKKPFIYTGQDFGERYEKD